jgi:amino acid permease
MMDKYTTAIFGLMLIILVGIVSYCFLNINPDHYSFVKAQFIDIINLQGQK